MLPFAGKTLILRKGDSLAGIPIAPCTAPRHRSAALPCLPAPHVTTRPQRPGRWLPGHRDPGLVVRRQCRRYGGQPPISRKLSGIVAAARGYALRITQDKANSPTVPNGPCFGTFCVPYFPFFARNVGPRCSFGSQVLILAAPPLPNQRLGVLPKTLTASALSALAAELKRYCVA